MASARKAVSAVERFASLFKHKTGNVIGMIHVAALPGTPCSDNDVHKIVDEACKEAVIYKDLGVDGLIVENMHDVPYLMADSVGPETTAVMTAVCLEVKRLFKPNPVGIQILAGANRHAMAVAKAAGLEFIRAEGFVFSHVADEGLMSACAGDLMRYRHSIGADNVLVFADVKKKHSAHAITADVDIVETAKAAQFFLADGVIVTGAATGQAASTQEMKAVLQNVQMPVLVGSGVTPENYDQYRYAHAVIVGSSLKEGGHWANRLDAGRLQHFMGRVREIRKKHVDATMII
ncbi:uncharacterized protein F13E9.13, mitochondrial-like [Babylonia areolata]|uniref:uncharacterized protein F13E9.13, mitochondrial-like n=1 Tax=Babylonia areolata TaxID=304850 RepID=UPI003FD16BCA